MTTKPNPGMKSRDPCYGIEEGFIRDSKSPFRDEYKIASILKGYQGTMTTVIKRTSFGKVRLDITNSVDYEP